MVVGAGFAGLAAARRLAVEGLRVVVLEAGRLGSGASGRTGGVVLEGTAAGELEGLGSALAALHQRVLRDRIDCQLELPGCLELAHREGAGGEGSGATWCDAGRRLVTVAEVPGGTVDPGWLLTGMARAAAVAGARIREGAAVRRLVLAPNLAVETADGRIRTGRVVVAAGASLADLVPEAGEIRAALTPAIATAPLPARLRRELGPAGERPFYTVDLPYLWGRPLPDGGLLFGAGLVGTRPGELAALRADRGELGRALRSLEGRIHGLCPVLAGLPVRRRFAGPVSFREGAVPILCLHPESPRVALTGAFAGHGVALAPLAGELAAEAVLGRRELPAWGRPATGGRGTRPPT